jgi:hypothetical protein
MPLLSHTPIADFFQTFPPVYRNPEYTEETLQNGSYSACSYGIHPRAPMFPYPSPPYLLPFPRSAAVPTPRFKFRGSIR